MKGKWRKSSSEKTEKCLILKIVALKSLNSLLLRLNSDEKHQCLERHSPVLSNPTKNLLEHRQSLTRIKPTNNTQLWTTITEISEERELQSSCNQSLLIFKSHHVEKTKHFVQTDAETEHLEATFR
jgi:hypothetical protein